MNIFLHELKSNLKSTVSWSISMVLLSAVFLGIYPAYEEGAEAVKKLLSGFPPEVLKAFGFDIEIIFSPLGFFSLVFTYIVICGSIQAMIMGTSLISKEFNKKTCDFLLTKPVSRSNVMSQKLTAGLVLIILTGVLVIGTTWIMMASFISDGINFTKYLMLSCTLFFIELMFFCLGILVAVIAQRIKSVIGISIGTVFGFFVAGMIGEAFDYENIRYFVPLKYYDSVKIISQSSYESVYLYINLTFIVVSIMLSYVIYVKRDIHSV